MGTFFFKLKVTKCTFHYYGPSGTIQNPTGICVLPQNNINEKIYTFIWFWLMTLAAITGAYLIYRIAVIFVPQLRTTLITAKVRI